MSSRKGMPTGLPVIHDRAAGIDIGSRFHVVAVGADLCTEPVQTFQAFASDLQRRPTGWSPRTSRQSPGVHWRVLGAGV